MTKSVGVLTYHNEYNFGATLQAFALQRTIQRLGYDCTIIDYVMPRTSAVRKLFQFRIGQLHYFRTTYNRLRHDLEVLVHFRHYLRQHQQHQALRRRFAEFQSCNLVLSGKTYQVASLLRADCPAFDIFVAGSDQIWNPSIWRPSMPGCDGELVFYLDVVSSKARRIAYAPSFGSNEMPVSYRARVSKLMGRFDFLSAREASGCKIIHDLTGREATQVLDPSLLLTASSYEKVATVPEQSGPYVLLYPVILSDKLNALSRYVSMCMKLPLVVIVPINLDPRQFAFANRIVSDAGPAEFLGWFGKSAFVCTNSYHGLAFSLVHHKPFLTVSHGRPELTIRSESLLARIGLLSRQLSHTSELRPEDRLLQSIDYAAVEERLRTAVNESLNYLERALA